MPRSAEAFMETSRGRWFLTEYAKRNRNADTRMVLDAVARIEQSLAAQKEEDLEREASLQREGLSAQQAAEAVAAAAAAQERLTEALAAIRSSVEAAQESAVEALDSLALEQRLAPVRKGARVLREIAWRLREIGNDGRICDLINSQVAVIEKGSEQISSEEARVALRAAFAALQGRLVEFGDDDPRAGCRGRSGGCALPAAPEMAPATVTAEALFGRGIAPRTLPRHCPAPPAMPRRGRAETRRKPRRPRKSPLAEETGSGDRRRQNAAAQDADAEDEAILDMIAMEMGAPDPIDDDEIAAAMAEPAHSRSPRRSNRRSCAKYPNRSSHRRRRRFNRRLATPAAARRRRPACGRNVARLEHSRQWHAEQAGQGGQRSAGADPAHEPGREDRVLLVSGLCAALEALASFHNAPAAFVASANTSLSGCFGPPPTSSWQDCLLQGEIAVKTRIIVNPMANKGNCGKRWPQIRAELEKHLGPLAADDIAMTREPNHATKLAREAVDAVTAAWSPSAATAPSAKCSTA